MNRDDMDEIFSRAAQPVQSQEDTSAQVAQVKAVILTRLRPVRPLASQAKIVALFLAVFFALAILAASLLGLVGIHVLSPLQRGLIYGALSLIAILAAVACAREMRPGAGVRIGALALGTAVVGFPLLASLLFSGYGTSNFAQQGIPCLVAGLAVAIPSGLLLLWVLRRGLILSWAKAGLAAGTLAGLTGLGMLELHCPNLAAIHIIVWHGSVVASSALLGLLLGSLADAIRRHKS